MVQYFELYSIKYAFLQLLSAGQIWVECPIMGMVFCMAGNVPV